MDVAGNYRLRLANSIVAIPGLECAFCRVSCLAAEIQVATLEHFDAVISKLRQIDGITETDTSLLLSSRIGE